MDNFITGLNAGTSLINGYFSGNAQRYNTKANAWGQVAQNFNTMANQYSQSISVFQQLGNQVRDRIEQQAMAQLNSGVDITQGTASYVRRHTLEQANNKITEIQDNLHNQYIDSLRVSNNQMNIANVMARNQYKSAMASGISGAFSEIINNYTQKNLYNNSNNETTRINNNNNNNDDDVNKNENLFDTNFNVNTDNLKLNLFDTKTNYNTKNNTTNYWWNHTNGMSKSPLYKDSKGNYYYDKNKKYKAS